MGLTARFVLLIVALVAALATSAFSGSVALHTLDSALAQTVRIDVARLLAITHTRRYFRSLVLSERDYVMTKTVSEREQLEHTILGLQGQLSAELDHYARLMPDEDRIWLADLREAQRTWTEEDERIRAMPFEERDTALELAKRQTRSPQQPWDRVIAQLISTCEKRLEQRFEHTHRAYLSAERELLLVSLGAGLIAVVAGWVIFLGIRRNVFAVVRVNHDLEAQVRRRTELLSARERALTLVLDSTGDGLIEVGRDACLTGVCSVAARRWFGPANPGTPLTDYILAADPLNASRFARVIAQLADEAWPLELWRDHLPRKLVRGTLTLALDFKRVTEAGAFAKILVILRDVSDTNRAEHGAGTSVEHQTALARLLENKTSFAHNVAECETLLDSLACGHDEFTAHNELQRLSRRLASIGAGSLSEACGASSFGRGVPSPATRACAIADLNSAWNSWVRGFERYMVERGCTWNRNGSSNDKSVEALFLRADCQEILSLVEAWGRTRSVERLARLRAHAEHLSERLGKHVHVAIEHNRVRLPPGLLEKFWPSLIHIIRTAIERAGERSSLQLTFATIQTPDGLCVELRDDGPAFEHDSLLLERRAQRPHLPKSVPLRTLVFMEDDGGKLRLAPVRQAAEEEGGSVDVSSEPGRGTVYRFRFRLPQTTSGLVGRLLRHSTMRPRFNAPPAEETAEPSQPRAAS